MGDYFVKIEDGTDLRRKVLESSKGALHILREQRHLQEIRGEKVALMNQLRANMRELTTLINKAEQLLPAIADAELLQLQKEPEKKGIKSPPKPIYPPKKLNEQERLERALAHIEQKLGEMPNEN